ncbi:hypothetical protein H0H93_004484 [Arthromyces matolae]|nr:hypothetical protein H0H93_004484 [Arthromyces matolae]
MLASTSTTPSTPTPRSRVPAIDTTLTHDDSSSAATPTSPFNDILTLQIPTSPGIDASPTLSPTTLRSHSSNKFKVNHTDRARTESRKLLAHVLDQLKRRTMPPSIFDAFNHPEPQGADNLGTLLQTVRTAISNPKRTIHDEKRRIPPATGDEDSDEEGDHEFSTDATYALMLQLKDLLRISMDQDWHILDENPPDRDDKPEASERPGLSTFRRPRNSLLPAGQTPRPVSPSSSNRRHARTPDLLSSCISILASVVLEDSRYQIAFPRPSCPPNALQALTLDVAQFLLHTHRHDPHIVSKIGFAIIPAFTTFRREMHGRLLSFFENSVIRGVLEDLEQVQGVNEIRPNIESEFRSELPSHRNMTAVVEPLNSAGSSVVAIHIDEVPQVLFPGSGHLHWNPWSLSPDNGLKLRSTYAPAQSLASYSLASLISPLLASILDSVDLEPQPDSRTDVLHRLSRLLRLIVEIKLDAYTDVLQVVGYHTHKARRGALSILSMLWPNAVGHNVISRPLKDLYTSDESDSPSTQYTSDQHCFVPWRFSPRLSPTRSSPSQDCQSCSELIQGFGLLCTLCLCRIHFECYDHPYGSRILQYGLKTDPNIQRVAAFRFSRSSPQHNTQKTKHSLIHTHGHNFRHVNILTLCLCFICHQPLWGCASQGLTCSSCEVFAHLDCLTRSSISRISPCSRELFDSGLVDISWEKLRQSCIGFYHDIFLLSYSDLEMLSFEEISTIHAIVWLQSQIISSGVALGSIVLSNVAATSNSQGHNIEEFELHHLIQSCEHLLSRNRQSSSNTMNDYMEENSLSPSEYFMMFDWTNLMYIRSILRSPYIDQQFSSGSSSDLLNVSHRGPLNIPSSDDFSTPFEMVPLSHMRDTLGHGLNIYSDAVARLTLSYLHHIGLFERTDHNPILFNGDDVRTIYCSFPLPCGLDLSPTVEMLVAAVEGCLQDLDLSVAETGLLLLNRRLWPNGLASDYALRRLTRCIISWILAEDDHLAIILRDYLARGQPLPGVRFPQDPVPWPLSDGPRPPPSTSNNGGDYLATRRALLLKYAKPWLSALHDLDPTVYASLVYESCVHLDYTSPLVANSVEIAPASVALHGSREAHYDRILRQITRLSSYQTIFTAFDNLFLLWLESASRCPLDEPFHSLPRLFPLDWDGTTVVAPESAAIEAAIDPWQLVIRTAAKSSDALIHSLRWLCIFSRSGVEIPLAIFKMFASLLMKYDSPLSESSLLAEAVVVSTWLRPKGRQEIQNLLSELHERLAPRIVTATKAGGVDNKSRRLNVRASMAVDPVVIDPRLMISLEKYLNADSDAITGIIGTFFHLFLTGSPYLEAYEVDNFVLRNGSCLAKWQVFPNTVVDSEPFGDVLETWFLPTSSWERRLIAVTRLFRVILDVIGPSFNTEDRQWRSGLADIFYYFFTSLWADQKVKYITYIVHPTLTFAVLSWDAIVEALVENDYNENDPAAAHLSLYGFPSARDPELVRLRASVVFLALQMIADGIPIDNFMLLKIKSHLVTVINFRDVLTSPAQSGQLFQIQFGEVTDIPDTALPCIDQLVGIMDASHLVDIPPSVMATHNGFDDQPVTVLIGSVLIDVFLSMFCSVQDFAALPVITIKSMLKTMCIIIYKHDFECQVLKPLQPTLRRAVVRTLDCLTLDISYELRQVAFSVVDAFVKRWHSIMGPFIYTAVEAFARLLATQSQNNNQDALLNQAKMFLDRIFTSNAKNNPGAPHLIHDLLLRDAFTRVSDADSAGYQNVLNNIQTYVEVVYHENYSVDTLQFAGQQLVISSRRASEWSPEIISPEPILITLAVITSHNKALSREILSYADTILRVLLSRSNVGTEGLSRLLQATSSPQRNSANDSNNVLNSLLEILCDGLKLKARILPSTLNSILEVISMFEAPSGFPYIISHLSLFRELVEPAIHFLQNHPWQDVEKDFAASVAAAKLALQVSAEDLNMVNRLFDHNAEKPIHSNLKMRTWSIFVLAALQEQKESWYNALFAQLPVFSFTYHNLMRACSTGPANMSESAIVDLNYAYIAIKLWILLSLKVSGNGDAMKDLQGFSVWNELWPPFDGIITQFELDPGGPMYLTVGTLVLSSVAELFIFLRSLHTPIALELSTLLTTLNRLRQLGPGDTVNQKLSRAMRYISEAPPETTFEIFVSQTAKDIVAAEKLRLLETRAGQDRKTPDRHRRDLRATG